MPCIICCVCVLHFKGVQTGIKEHHSTCNKWPIMKLLVLIMKYTHLCADLFPGKVVGKVA